MTTIDKIHNFANNFTPSRMEQFLYGRSGYKSTLEELQENESDEWILRGLELKGVDYWNKRGFGLFFSSESFRDEITAALEEPQVSTSKNTEELVYAILAFLRENNLYKEYTYETYNTLPTAEREEIDATAEKHELSESRLNKLESGYWSNAPYIFDGREWWYYNPDEIMKNWDLMLRYHKYNRDAVRYALDNNHLRTEWVMLFTKKITPSDFANIQVQKKYRKELPTLEQLKSRQKNGFFDREKIQIKVQI